MFESKGAQEAVLRALQEEILLKRSENYRNIFAGKMAQNVVEFVAKTYGGQLEFLWLNSPKSAVFRHQKTLKWYGVMMSLGEEKLGLKSSKETTLLNLKATPEALKAQLDGVHFFPAFHMNKTHWLSVKLDEDVDFEVVKRLIKQSFQLTQKRQNRI